MTKIWLFSAQNTDHSCRFTFARIISRVWDKQTAVDSFHSVLVSFLITNYFLPAYGHNYVLNYCKWTLSQRLFVLCQARPFEYIISVPKNLLVAVEVIWIILNNLLWWWNYVFILSNTNIGRQWTGYCLLRWSVL